MYLPTDHNFGGVKGPDNMLPHDAAQDASATRLFAGHVPPLHSELSEHVGLVVRNTCVLVGEALN